MPVGTINGTKYQDTNGDGTRDGGEPGLRNWVLYADLDNDDRLDLVANVEPDDYANGTVLNTIEPGITLTGVGTEVVGSPNVTANTGGCRLYRHADDAEHMEPCLAGIAR